MTSKEPASLIPRAKIFGNPTHADCQISPDGRWLSWLAPSNGVLNIWIAPVGEIAAARVITDDRKRGIRVHAWMPSSTHVLYMQDEGGTENWRVYAVEIEGGTARDLTPIDGVQAQLYGTSVDRPGTIAVGLNDRNASWHDLYHVDIATGARELVFTNDRELGGIVVDRQLRPRLASKSREVEGGSILYRINGTEIEAIGTVEHEDDLTTHDVAFTRDGGTYYRVSSVGRDRTALLAIDSKTGEERVIASHPKADIDASSTLVHPETFVIEAVGANYLRLEWLPLTDSIKPDLDRLQAALPGDIDIASRTRDDSRWIVVSGAAERPVSYHLYTRASGEIVELFSSRPELRSFRLAPMHGQVIRSRDGLELTSYLTLPASEGSAARPQSPLPLVLLVHGGPWARDDYGYNAQHQWLANRGYAVLSVNFRASTGFGKAFLNAGDGEWGRKMHDDLVDAVEWAVEEGIARRGQVAIMGASYGGYATLAGLAFTPELFCCGVDIVGPSNLETLLATIPPYWAAFFENLARRVGDPRTESGRQLLRERSPLHSAGAIARPLLIAQGANDPRVKQAEADQIVEAMRAKGLAVTYVLYPEEGHGFAVPQNRMSFYAIAEAFLAEHLGGDCEPLANDLTGANFEVPHGATHVPGLADALGVSAKA